MNRYLTVLSGLAVVIFFVASGLTSLNEPLLGSPPDEDDPCDGTSGYEGALGSVCFGGEEVTSAEGPVVHVEGGNAQGVDYVAFTVLTTHPQGGPFHGTLDAPVEDPRVVFSRDSGPWSAHLPGSRSLLVRFDNDTALALGEDPVEAGDPYRIVGLKTPMLDEWRDALQAEDVSIHGYLPVNHVLVRLEQGADEQAINDLAFVHDVQQVHPAMKVEPGITSANGTLMLHVSATRNESGALDAVEQRVLDLGGTVLHRVDRLDRLTVLLDPENVSVLAQHPETRWINPTSDEAEGDMDVIRVRTGAEAVQLDPLAFNGTGVRGQVMDLGLQADHPDFERCLLGIDTPSFKLSNHGTMSFGVVCGSGEGDSSATGMAPGAQVSFAQHDTEMSRYEAAMNLSANWGGVFQTHSWGLNGLPKDNTYDLHAEEMDRIVDDLDVLAIQSMSNFGPENARREAMAKNIVSVGGLRHFNDESLNVDRWYDPGCEIPHAHGASCASTGPASDGRIKPELVGPYDSVWTTTTGSGYGTYRGTSSATPVNAGAVAIVHQMVSEGHFGLHPSGTGSPAAVKALLTASAHTYRPNQVVHTIGPPEWVSEPYKRDIQGWGVFQLEWLAQAGDEVLLVDQESAVATGAVSNHLYDVPVNATGLQISLTWTDPPANPSAQAALVNDLDLKVVGPDGVLTYTGNHGLQQAPYSLPGQISGVEPLPDRLNNLEKVILPASVANTTVTIEVHGAAVQHDQDPGTPGVAQPYALAVVPVFE